MQLFDSDNEDNQTLGFKKNEDFARKYEHNERRKEIDRLGAKYEDASDDESGEEEDSEGMLLNQ